MYHIHDNIQSCNNVSNGSEMLSNQLLIKVKWKCEISINKILFMEFAIHDSEKYLYFSILNLNFRYHAYIQEKK